MIIFSDDKETNELMQTSPYIQGGLLKYILRIAKKELNISLISYARALKKSKHAIYRRIEKFYEPIPTPEGKILLEMIKYDNDIFQEAKELYEEEIEINKLKQIPLTR